MRAQHILIRYSYGAIHVVFLIQPTNYSEHSLSSPFPLLFKPVSSLNELKPILDFLSCEIIFSGSSGLKNSFPNLNPLGFIFNPTTACRRPRIKNPNRAHAKSLPKKRRIGVERRTVVIIALLHLFYICKTNATIAMFVFYSIFLPNRVLQSWKVLRTILPRISLSVVLLGIHTALPLLRFLSSKPDGTHPTYDNSTL